jgi:hypothetical protein
VARPDPAFFARRIIAPTFCVPEIRKFIPDRLQQTPSYAVRLASIKPISLSRKGLPLRFREVDDQTITARTTNGVP